MSTHRKTEPHHSPSTVPPVLAADRPEMPATLEWQQRLPDPHGAFPGTTQPAIRLDDSGMNDVNHKDTPADGGRTAQDPKVSTGSAEGEDNAPDAYDPMPSPAEAYANTGQANSEPDRRTLPDAKRPAGREESEGAARD